MNWTPFSLFPREVGFPNRAGIVSSAKELIEKINIYNGKSTVFTSLYSFDEVKNERGIYSSSRVNQIFFDIDNPTSLKSIKILHDYCLDNDYIHCIFFSGQGFHLYISAVYPNQLKNKRGAIMNAQTDISDKTKLKIGTNGDSDVDSHSFGNLAQLVRVPGTYNIRRKRYCITLSEADLKTSLGEIKEKALYQRSGIYLYGEKFLDLSPFDSEPKTGKYELDIELGESDRIGEERINTKIFPPCIQNLLSKRTLKHKERFTLILYLRELGIPMEDTIALLKANLDPKVYFHCVHQERQIFWCYRREDLSFSSCSTLKLEGLCSSQSCGGIKLYA